MSKQLRRFLASLLVISLLVTGLSFAALSEAAPTEPVETQVVATAEEPAVEVTETSTEEPAVEAMEAPMEEPEAESTEAPAEESAAEATEAPTEEPSDELSDVQKAALENLPAGFSAGTVALAMMRSTGCAHTDLHVWENSDPRQYTALNDEKHTYTYRVKSRTLYCNDCGETLQEITVNETISGEERHAWVNVDTTSVIKCIECGMTQKLENPCSHSNKYSMGEDGNLYCWVCGAIVVLNPEQTYCKHTNYTEYGTMDSPLVEYAAFSKEQHVKHSDIMIFSDGWGFAICDDCGEWLELKNGKVSAVGITDYSCDDMQRESVLEPHTFENGVCKYCGYQKQEEDEQKPYVRGFTMSQTTAKVGDTVKFTLELANVKDGEALELQFIADGQLIETFSLTAPQNTFEHEFSKAGNRKLQFRVTGGECCPEQTLKVETNAPKVETVSLSLGTGKNFTITEKAEGEKITAKIACNGNTSVAELYVGESYAFSEEYVEENGKRIFTLEITLGGNNACYADKYEMRANALKQRYVFDDMDKKSIGTLTVKHDYVTTETSSADKFWKKSTAGHERYEKVTTNKICKACANETKETTERVIVNLTAHSYNADGVCEVCGWGENRLSSATVLNKHVEDSSDYYYGNDFILFKKGASVQAGYIRFVSQIPGYTGTGKLEPAAFDKTQWQWGKIDRSGEAAGLCSYAALSMQLSYLGIDCTPGKMFKILNLNESSNFEYGFNRKTIIEYLNDTENASIDSEMKRLVDKNLSKENLDAMLSKYETDFNCSPIFMFMEYGEKWKRTHAVLIIGREGNTYYIANPETRTGMGSFEIEVKDDGIMYITNASTAKYNGRRISLIAQTCKTK